MAEDSPYVDIELSEKEKEIYEEVKRHLPATKAEWIEEYIRRLKVKVLEKSYVLDELQELIREKHETNK